MSLLATRKWLSLSVCCLYSCGHAMVASRYNLLCYAIFTSILMFHTTMPTLIVGLSTLSLQVPGARPCGLENSRPNHSSPYIIHCASHGFLEVHCTHSSKARAQAQVKRSKVKVITGVKVNKAGTFLIYISEWRPHTLCVLREIISHHGNNVAEQREYEIKP